MKRGVPPTARKARTGELTPPGVTARARASRAADAGASVGVVASVVVGCVTLPSSQPPVAPRSGGVGPAGGRRGVGSAAGVGGGRVGGVGVADGLHGLTQGRELP